MGYDSNNICMALLLIGFLFCILLILSRYARKVEPFQCIQFDVVGKGALDASVEMDYGKIKIPSNGNTVKFNKKFQNIPVVFTQVIGEGAQVPTVTISQITRDEFSYSIQSIQREKIPVDKEDIDEENPANNLPIERLTYQNTNLMNLHGFYWLAFVKNNAERVEEEESEDSSKLLASTRKIPSWSFSKSTTSTPTSSPKPNVSSKPLEE
jgi:hypothetical protein